MQAISIIKFDPSNNIIWDKLISSTKGKNLQPFSIAMSICGSIWVCGTMDSMDINIDGHLLATPLRSSDPVFIAGFNSNGTYISSAAASSGGDDLNRIACDHFGNVYLCSDYGALKNFILGNDTLPAGGEFLYLAKYKYLNIGSPISEYSSKTVCLEKDTIMQAISGYSNYIWSDGHIGQTHGVFDTGTFLVNGSVISAPVGHIVTQAPQWVHLESFLLISFERG